MQNNLTKALIEHITQNRKQLTKLNKLITSDTDYAIEYDCDYTIEYLKQFSKNFSHILDKTKKSLKPKGEILIIMSYNEPFVMSVIPILSAILVGNSVTIKPSIKSLNFFENIWIESNIKSKFNLNIEIFKGAKKDLEHLIPKMAAVYFFGGYTNATLIAKKCAKTLVEFFPEIEAADCKVVSIDNNINDINNDSIMTLHDSLLHSGQSCQRIQGVFVKEEIYKEYSKSLENQINEMIKSGDMEKYIDKDYKPNEILLENFKTGLLNSGHSEIIKSNTKSTFPQFIYNLPKNSKFIKSAQFLPTLWVLPYKENTELIQALNSRTYKLGLNIISNDTSFIEEIIKSTCFTRYTINTNHSFIRYNEGWGGIAPTGFNGYRSWIEHFSYPFTVIKE